MLDALTADLGRRFHDDYAVVGERSAAEALEELGRLAADAAPVALIFASPSLEEMHGVEFLARAHGLHPRAKRVLLVDRGDWTSSHPAIRAMTLGQIDSYVFNPWGPWEERYLYLPIAELLADWISTQPPAREVVVVVGRDDDGRAHELQDFLARAGLPFGIHGPDSETGRAVLDRAGLDGSSLPVMVFYTGNVLCDPSDAALAEALGFPTRPPAATYDVAVVGAGPAGLAAAVYAASEGLRTLVLEPSVPGGQASTSSSIRNYLGFPRGLSGDNFSNRIMEQAWLFGADVVLAQSATGLRPGNGDGADRVLTLADGSEVAATTVIVATGVSWRRLDVPSLDALQGAGVFYGAAGAEARALTGAPVFVVGAGNSAGQAAIHLAEYAASVTILVRGQSLGASMSAYLVDKIGATANISVRLRTEVTGGEGAGRLERVAVRDNLTATVETLPAAAIFIMIGAEPHTDWLAGCVARDPGGYVLTGRDVVAAWPLDRPPLLLETSMPGVFAAGDVRSRSVKRVASAAGEGAIAVQLIHEYLADRDR